MAEAVDSGTYTSDTLKRKIALSLLGESMKPQPIRHWAEGLAQMGRSALGGYLAYQAGEEEKANSAAQSEALKSLLGGGSSEPTGSVPNAGASPMGALPSMNSRVYSENEFNPIDAQVATPQELAAGVPAPKQYAALIGKAAVDNDLPPELLAAQLKQESGFNPNAVSPVGAQGISQFMPGTAKEMGVNPLDPASAIPGGARYLRQNIDKFGGSVPLGLAAYNAGPGRVQQSGGDISKLPAETRGYIANILSSQGGSPGTQVAQAGGDTRARVIQMLNDKNPAVQKMGRSLASNLVAKQFEGEKPTDDIKEYERAQKDPAFRQYMIDMKKAGSQSISIDQRGEAEFDKKAAGHQAERFDKLVQGGMDAKAMSADLNALKDIGSRITTGKTAELTAALGPYAEAAGVKIEGLDDLQAYKSIVAKLAPRMRVAGSGATSDFEMRQFLEALPGLGKTPGGNEMISTTLEALQAHKEQAAEIASRAMNKELTPREADKLLRSLPDPLTAWKQSKGTTTLKPTSNAPAGTTKTGLPWKVVD